jgi:hypothetical protein
MVGGDRSRTAGAIAAGVALVMMMAGCADAEQSAPVASVVGDVTLAQSKSYAQLLRNEASSRLPAIVLKEVSESTDTSVPCDVADGDPAELVRSWSSSTRILITNSTASRIQKVTDDLAQTFVDQGWTSSLAPESTDDLTVTGLTSDASLASIEITTASKAKDQVPSITITATGACALTGGPESDEVIKLESQEPAAEG